MAKNTKNNQLKDNDFLQQLLLQPVWTSSRWDGLKVWLSDASWQGISAILSLFSLLISTVLTLYIFQLTQIQTELFRSQQSANIYATVVSWYDFCNGSDNNIGNCNEYTFLIRNVGPASAGVATIIIRSSNILSCKTLTEDANISTVNYDELNRVCSIVYNDLVPFRDVYVSVITYRRLGVESINVSGENVIYRNTFDPSSPNAGPPPID